MDCDLALRAGEIELRMARNYPMFERGGFRGFPGTEVEPDGTALHEDERVMTIFAERRGGQADDIAGLHLL